MKSNINESMYLINLENNLVRKDCWNSIALKSRRFKQLYDIAFYTKNIYILYHPFAFPYLILLLPPSIGQIRIFRVHNGVLNN